MFNQGPVVSDAFGELDKKGQADVLSAAAATVAVVVAAVAVAAAAAAMDTQWTDHCLATRRGPRCEHNCRCTRM